MVKINKQIVSQNVINNKSHGKGNTKEFIAIHETANIGKGANAQSHANLQANMNSREASWHYTVDDKGIIQSFPDSIRCWHGGNKGNARAISIEICVNSDGDFKKAVANAVALVQYLMKKYGIPASKVKQHNYFTGKNCPTNLRNGAKGITWPQFIADVKGKKIPVSNTTSKPKKPATSSGKSPNSVIDYLESKGQSSSFSNRKKLAAKHGISNYKGTASQNATLLSKLRKGSKKPNSSFKGDIKTTSIVTYLQSINEPWSLENRKKLAKQHGIKNYSGKSIQNLMLLDKLRKGSKTFTSKRTKANLKVDGYMGVATIKALQRYYKTPVDGKLSQPSLVIKKLQKTVGTKVDGYMGKKTVRAMQKHYKTHQDGILSKPSLVIKKLQSALNKGEI